MDFVSQVPEEVLQKTEIQPCGNTTLFKPMLYVGGVNFDVADYHIVIPSEVAPGALVNGKMIRGSERRVLIVNPGDTVCCVKNAPAKQYYSLLIKVELLQKVAGEMGFSDSIRFNDFLNPFSMELFQLLKNLDCEFNRPTKMNLVLDCIEIQIAALLLRKFKTNMTIQAPLCENVNPYIKQAKEYIQCNYDANISLNDICNTIHVSEYHFLRMFKRQVGLTPHKYLVKLRIEKAKAMLGSKQYTVSETALLCGFESASYFSTTFKNITGYTPVAYMNMGNACAFL